MMFSSVNMLQCTHFPYFLFCYRSCIWLG